MRVVFLNVDLESARELIPGSNYLMDLGLGAQRVHLIDWWAENGHAKLQLVSLEEWEDRRPDPHKFIITDDDRRLMSAMGIRL